jgi:hypothetical protein
MIKRLAKDAGYGMFLGIGTPVPCTFERGTQDEDDRLPVNLPDDAPEGPTYLLADFTKGDIGPDEGERDGIAFIGGICAIQPAPREDQPDGYFRGDVSHSFGDTSNIQQMILPYVNDGSEEFAHAIGYNPQVIPIGPEECNFYLLVNPQDD